MSEVTCAVFFEMKKGFDSVLHRGFLGKIKELQLKPILVRWICSYPMGISQTRTKQTFENKSEVMCVQME